jgi:VanZ family protein
MNYKVRLTKYLFYFSLFFLFLVYLLPGKIFELKDSVENRTIIDGSIDHFYYFTYLTILGLATYINKIFFYRVSIILLGLSILIEFLHMYVPNRNFSLFDILANVSGYLLGFFIITITKKKN